MNTQHSNYLQLRSVIRQADFKLKGDAVITVAHLLKWFDEIEPMFKEQAKKPVIKKLKD